MWHDLVPLGLMMIGAKENKLQSYAGVRAPEGMTSAGFLELLSSCMFKALVYFGDVP